MNYRSVPDLNRDIHRWPQKLPSEVDLIVGVPRSGLLAANLLALHLNVPLTTIGALADGTVLESGHRLRHSTDISSFEELLIVDDSVWSGQTMEEVKEQVDALNLSANITYGAVYVTDHGKDYVDTYAEYVPMPRVFEWNMMHHLRLPNWAVDLDGVLCRNPLPSENDDGERYREFIRTVEPRVVPTRKIGYIVTCRLEKYRELTEAWLENHGIEYGQLVMMDHPSMEARRAAGNHAEYKANVYENTDARLFIESNERQAKTIARRTRKPVFCVDANCMYRQEYLTRVQRETLDSVQTIKAEPRRIATMLLTDPITFGKKASRRILNPR